MKLADGIKMKGRPAEIPDCSRDDLPEFFKELGFKSGAEIGVNRGEYTEVLAKSGLQIFAIDPWKTYSDYGNSRGQEKLSAQYEHAQKILAPYSNVKIIRKTSMEALKDFPDESLDFAYIDGNHWFKYVAEDICEWAKKVRKGGIISGHDYIYTKSHSYDGVCHVHFVVDAYIKAYKISDFWLLGRRRAGDGEKRDRWRSWMWFKNYSDESLLRKD